MVSTAVRVFSSAEIAGATAVSFVVPVWAGIVGAKVPVVACSAPIAAVVLALAVCLEENMKAPV